MNPSQMSLQPPLVPGMPGIPFGGNYAPTSSPFFTIANQFLPRNLHDVIRWARYITMQSPVTTEVLRKYSTYPITDFVYETDNEASKNLYSNLFETMKMKSVLHDIGFEYHSIGNVFLSLYTPIHRELVCRGCSSRYQAKTANFLKFSKFSFTGECPKCHWSGTFERHDRKSMNIADMNIIKWDPLNIAVNNNPITGEYKYYYKIPNDVKRRVQMGDRLFVDSVPWEFIECIKDQQDFEFAKDAIFHLRNISTGQVINGIAVPPLISLFNLVFYQATLRRANESIATDFMSPMRVIFPQAQTGNSDPAVQMSLKSFVAHMQQNVVRHKTDRNHVVVAPIPIGYQTISGEGKTLLVSAEIEAADRSILLSLGVSEELLSGQTNWTSSTVGLRLLENTLQCYTGQIESFIQWVVTKISSYMGWEDIPVTLAPFRLSDDANFQQMLMTAVAAGKGSYTTLYESFGEDYNDELNKIKQEAVDTATTQIEMQLEVEQAQFLAAKKLSDNFDKNNDYKSALQKAQQIAEELFNTDDSTKRQVLNQLKIDDYAMYLLVAKLLQEESEARSAEMAMQQAAMAGGQPGQDPNDPNAQQGGQGPGDAGSMESDNSNPDQGGASAPGGTGPAGPVV
jgi:hypothetical protein